MSEILEQIKRGKYGIPYIVKQLYPDGKYKSNHSKFINKLHGTDGRSFTDDEIGKIEAIVKS